MQKNQNLLNKQKEQICKIHILEKWENNSRESVEVVSKFIFHLAKEIFVHTYVHFSAYVTMHTNEQILS